MDDTDPRKYMQVAAELRDMIRTGELAPGARTPSVAAYRARTGYARQTIAKAMQMLETEGLLRRVPGHGYLVRGGSIP